MSDSKSGLLAKLANSVNEQGEISGVDSAAVQSLVDVSVNGLINSAPETLNTLDELAAALNDDANFASTVTTSIATKANSADLAAVATSGSYNDLSDLPVISSGSSGAVYATEQDIPISGNNVGDIAFVTGDTTMRIWNGSVWVTQTIVIPPTTVEFVVVAGGGSSYYLYNYGVSTGGGGAGGYISSVSGELSGAQTPPVSPFTVNAGDTYTVEVGAGGSIGTTGSNGENSAFYGESVVNNILTQQSVTAIGGGHGGTHTVNATSGGSGGGAQGTNTVGSGTANQGNDGRQQYSNFYGAGAGGSAGAPHPDYDMVSGVGIDTNITGTNLKLGGGGNGGQAGREGPNAYGGGRSGYYPPSSGTIVSSTPGSPNTGGGGGGGSNRTATGNSGGSGVVILRCSAPASATTGSPEEFQTDAGWVYKFNGLGTITF